MGGEVVNVGEGGSLVDFEEWEFSTPRDTGRFS